MYPTAKQFGDVFGSGIAVFGYFDAQLKDVYVLYNNGLGEIMLI
jgi:hypothetical protein